MTADQDQLQHIDPVPLRSRYGWTDPLPEALEQSDLTLAERHLSHPGRRYHSDVSGREVPFGSLPTDQQHRLISENLLERSVARQRSQAGASEAYKRERAARVCAVDHELHAAPLADLVLGGRKYEHVCELHRLLATQVWLTEFATPADTAGVRRMLALA